MATAPGASRTQRSLPTAPDRTGQRAQAPAHLPTGWRIKSVAGCVEGRFAPAKQQNMHLGCESTSCAPRTPGQIPRRLPPPPQGANHRRHCPTRIRQRINRQKGQEGPAERLAPKLSTLSISAKPVPPSGALRAYGPEAGGFNRLPCALGAESHQRRFGMRDC